MATSVVRQGKLSQEELAARVGVSRQAVSKWELGEAAPDINKLLALARAFGVTTDRRERSVIWISTDSNSQDVAPSDAVSSHSSKCLRR